MCDLDVVESAIYEYANEQIVNVCFALQNPNHSWRAAAEIM